MFSNLTDRHFEQIGNMATTPYVQSPEYELNPYTTQNFVIGLALEKYQNKFILNEKLRKEHHDYIFSDSELYKHTWNYDERIVKPAEYLFVTKIAIPEPSKQIEKRNKSKPMFIDVINTNPNNRYNSDIDISTLLCTESFESFDSINNSISLNNKKSSFTPRRPKTFKYNMRAVNNITKSKPDMKKSHKKISGAKKSHKKKL